MNAILIVLFPVTLLCIYEGINYLAFFIRIREFPEHLTFSLSCFTFALYLIACGGLYGYQSTPEWHRFVMSSAILFCIAITWFIKDFTGHPGKRRFIAVSVAGGSLILSSLLAPDFLIIDTNGTLVDIPGGLFFGVENTALTSPGILQMVQYGAAAILVAYLGYLILDFYRSGNSREAAPLLVSLPLFAATAANDALVRAGVSPLPFLVPFGFVPVLLSMAHILRDRFVLLHQEAEEMNNLLEEKINDSLMDLFISEIGTRMYIDTINQFSGIRNESASAEAIQNLIDTHKAATILSLSQEIALMTDVDRLLEKVASRIMDISNAQHCALYLKDGEGRMEHKTSVHEQGLDTGVHYPAVEEAVVRGEYLITETVVPGEDDRPRYIAAIPFKVNDKIIGACYLENRISRNVFTRGDIELLFGFMAQLSIPIYNAYRATQAGMTWTRRPRRSLSPRTEKKIQNAIVYLRDNYREDISREGLAASISMHPDSFSRFFKSYTGKRINEFVNEIRVEEAARQLRDTDSSVTDIAFDVGFESLTTFNRLFRKIMKKSPTEYRASLDE